MKVTCQTNGYEISPELTEMLQRFNAAVEKTFPDWEVSHFYYGDRLIMTDVSNKDIKEYAHFNITANRVSFNGHTLTSEHKTKCEALTHNDELFNGKLFEIVGL